MNKYVCRCCLKENALQTYKIFDDCFNLCEDLKMYLPVTLKCEYNDGLPQIVCDSCWQQVQQFKDFHRMCLLSDEELRSRYADYKNQAVEEVLGLIEKLREKDKNSWQQQYLCGDVNEKSQTFSEIDTFEISQLSGDYDLYSSSHDSGIFEDDEFSQQCLYNLDSFIEEPADQNNLFDLEPSTPSKRRNYKGPFPCNHCEKKFTRNFQLKLHLISVHQIGDGLQYTCQLCSKTFASHHSLSYHQKSVHLQEKSHFCTQCNRQFVLKSQLVSHMRIHTGELKPRILECEECGKKYPTKSVLRTHMRSHDPSMERPFKCDRCEKSFFTRGHLIAHQLVHTGEKPFICEFCNRSYQSLSSLNNHLSHRHITDIVQRRSQEEWVLVGA